MKPIFAAVLMTTMACNLPEIQNQDDMPKLEFPLLFWEAEDISDPFGRIEFRAEPLRNLGAASDYPHMQYGCQVPKSRRRQFYLWVARSKLGGYGQPGA